MQEIKNRFSKHIVTNLNSEIIYELMLKSNDKKLNKKVVEYVSILFSIIVTIILTFNLDIWYSFLISFLVYFFIDRFLKYLFKNYVQVFILMNLDLLELDSNLIQKIRQKYDG